MPAVFRFLMMSAMEYAVLPVPPVNVVFVYTAFVEPATVAVLLLPVDAGCTTGVEPQKPSFCVVLPAIFVPLPVVVLTTVPSAQDTVSPSVVATPVRPSVRPPLFVPPIVIVPAVPPAAEPVSIDRLPAVPLAPPDGPEVMLVAPPVPVPLPVPATMLVAPPDALPAVALPPP